MIQKNLIIFIFAIFTVKLYALDELTASSNPIKLPQSPNIAEFPIYGDVPVDYHTGTMCLSIPIFEIDIDGCKVPISVSYNATGIKVSQHASNVGLGWILNFGGIITSDCYGYDDFDCHNDGYNCNRFFKGIPEDSVIDYYRMTNKGVDISTMDTRPDIYHYSYCGNHGEMLFPPKESHRPVLLKADQYLDIFYTHDNQTWLIYDGNGNKFHFGNKPHVSMNTSFHGFPTINCESYLGVVDDPRVGGYSWDYHSVNAWPLDTITTSRGRYIIFKYKRESLLTAMMPHEEVRVANIADYGQCNVSTRVNYLSHNATNIIQSVPTEIIFPNGKVTFYSSNRLDIWDGIYTIYEDTDSPTKIDSIVVTNSLGKVIRRAVFYYHYAGNISSPNTCRLILDSIGGLEPRPYKFDYYNLQLPKKNSRQIDMWGYYNQSKSQKTWSTTWSKDREDEGTLMPSMMVDNRMFYGRNRSCNTQTVTNAMLKEVIYPTGGRSVFEYEPHSFPSITTEAEFINDEIKIESTCLILNIDFTRGNAVSISTPAQSYVITIEEGDDIVIAVESFAALKGPSSAIGIADIDITNTINGNNVYHSNISLYQSNHKYDLHPSLPAGTYRISLSYNKTSTIPLPNDYNNTETSVYVCENVYYREKNRGGNALEYGGGLRIKSISNYDSNSLTQKKEYKYLLTDSTSSGKLYVTPRFSHIFLEECLHRNDPEIAPCGAFVYTLANSAPLVSPQPMISPIVIGYDKVQEFICPYSENGKTEYEFYNVGANCPSEFPNFMAVPYPLNGTLKSQKTYDANNILRKKIDYNYAYTWGNEFYGLHTLKLFPERYYRIANQYIGNIAMFKYSIQPYSIKNTIITNTDYYNDGTIRTFRAIEYDTINFLPSHVLTYTSGGDTIKQRSVYPTQVNSAAANLLKEYHLYNKPLQQDVMLFDDGATITDYVYTEDMSKILLNEIREIRNAGNSDSILTYKVKSFDMNGNPTCIISQSHIPTAYLWGCNQLYPIIIVAGAEYSEIVSSLSPGFINALENSCNVSIPMLKSVYNSLQSHITSGDIHIYSYEPYVGIRAEIDSRGIIYSYEYDEFNRLLTKYIETDEGRFVVEKYEYHFYEK